MVNKSLSGAMNVLKDLKTIHDYTNSSSQTDKGNRVEADLDTTHLNFSLGYKF